MPIHFKCHTCKRRLSVGSHKAGSDALCPSCGATIRVPTQADVAALAAMNAATASGSADKPGADFSDFRFEEDIAIAPGQSARPRQDTPVERFDPQYVSISRKALYAQAGLIAIVALGCFVLGYLAGMAGGAGSPVAQAPVAQPLVISGKLFYQPQPGQSTPDAGAVMILLPEEAIPDELLPIAGLRPTDAALEAENPAVQAIRTLGGVYVRAGENGEYKFSLPKVGKYRVLRLSRHAARAPGNDPERADIETLSRYFSNPAELLGPQKYTWSTLQVEAGATLAHDFGVDGG
jgi:hypothetical protein